MFFAANFIEAVARILDIGLTIYMWIIVIRAVLSWVNPDPYNVIVQFLFRVTEPVLYRVRRFLPFGNLGIDFSPVIVILVIIFLQSFLIRSLYQLALQFK
ncbi:MAG TPA: YggT family protein [Syntrophales bacterium]|nr:YggT family protein [Syntrophales bacterium]HPX11972.1 YggT family protein [Syntrophales bacterium]HQB31028.1 YggT family protein [Syntrophales bacterium]HQN79281.1 YggT family protein [Syntrophales bacterium]HQQ26430.1 YggT family protein [Syntrophales bacterium]